MECGRSYQVIQIFGNPKFRIFHLQQGTRTEIMSLWDWVLSLEGLSHAQHDLAMEQPVLLSTALQTLELVYLLHTTYLKPGSVSEATSLYSFSMALRNRG